MQNLRLVSIISLSGVAFNALGGLYLAYDLFGAQRGLLRLVTKSATYGLIFLLGYGIFLNRRFGLVGGILFGPAIAIEHFRHSEGRPEGLFEMVLFAFLRAGGLGAAGWLTLDRNFGIALGLIGTITLTGAYVLAGPAGKIRRFSPKVWRRMVLIGASRGLAFGLAAALSSVLLEHSRAIWFALRIGIVTGIFSAVITAAAPSIEWWADHLPPRWLGAYGAFLLLIGSTMQGVQYVLPLMGIRID
jgi:hypothetical protein